MRSKISVVLLVVAIVGLSLVGVASVGADHASTELLNESVDDPVSNETVSISVNGDNGEDVHAIIYATEEDGGDEVELENETLNASSENSTSVESDGEEYSSYRVEATGNESDEDAVVYELPESDDSGSGGGGFIGDDHWLKDSIGPVPIWMLLVAVLGIGAYVYDEPNGGRR